MSFAVKSPVSDEVPALVMMRPWDSPGKNTGVGCHFLLQCMKVKSESEVTQSRPTLHDPVDCSPPGSSTHGILQARVLEWSATDYRVPNIGFTLCYPVTLGDFVKSLCFQYFKGTMDTIRVLSHKIIERIIGVTIC